MKKTSGPIENKTASDPVVVIGNGMVGHQFCRTFRSLNPTTPVTVIGKEPVPAYDRVHLTKLVTDPDPESLYLDPHAWYDDNHIDLRLGESVVAVDTTKKTVTTSGGSTLPYGRLVIASGSKAWIPPIEGAEGRNVFSYRTMADIEKIRTAARKGSSAAVLGGGLLGLEAAQALKELGVEVQILEIADYLMPQQLDAEGGIMLKDEVSNMGIFVRTRCQTQSIIDVSDQKILRYNDGQSIACDFVVISAGIRPETAYLKESSIVRNPQGAIIIDEGMETNIPDVYAIGECASLMGTVFGLVAPGYRMADVLAQRMTGEKILLQEKPDLSARLKVMGIHVAALGDYHQSDHLSIPVTFSQIIPRSGPCWRKLVIQKKRIIGMMVVGAWEGLPAAQQLMESGKKISWKQLQLFEETGELFKPTGEPAVMRWSNSTQICNCMMVKKGTLLNAIESGCGSVEELSRKTLAGTVCGSCKPVLSDLMGAPMMPTGVPASARIVIACSVLAFFGVGATVLAGPLAYADSVEIYRYKVEQLWRDSFLKQLTGYSLLALCLMALWLTVQKRFQSMKIGNYAVWRAVHTATGLLTLGMLFMHTGLSFGANFNAWLMLVFALLNLLGGLSGVFSGLETKTDSGIGLVSRRLKPVATWAHIILFWPIPVLVLFHIASVYYW